MIKKPESELEFRILRKKQLGPGKMKSSKELLWKNSIKDTRL